MKVTAPTLPSLFEEAARGLADLLADDARGAPSGPAEHVTLTSPDYEALLVEWLNELVYRCDVEGRVYADVTVDRIDEHGLDATIRGREPREPRTAVKAATWHGVVVRARADGYEASVVLDV